ncbi:hypothetical protein DSO57_1004838 [Entomophthora muscae]|uniref:Uncharacterized protein n=1 Tax=Entomophthora muscae TaxID=34485 RepID=A0ACC2SAR3_9FUNG|nr:hypothetical protein DSO57_1004838 [Entomophthora muscae]
MQGYAGSSKSEDSVYGHTQTTGPSPITTQECVLSPTSPSMALFAHHTQAAANPNHVSTLTPRIGQLSQRVTVRNIPDNTLAQDNILVTIGLNKQNKKIAAVPPY